MNASAHYRAQGEFPEYVEVLPRVPASAKSARHLVRTVLITWRMENLAGDGALIVSELVTNAVLHTRCPSIRVTMSRPGPSSVRIGVVDDSRVLPVRINASGTGTHGRGLALVEALAHRWGTDCLPYGKRVWGELAQRPGP